MKVEVKNPSVVEDFHSCFCYSQYVAGWLVYSQVYSDLDLSSIVFGSPDIWS